MLLKYYACCIIFCTGWMIVLPSCKSEPSSQTAGVKASTIAQLDTNQYTHIEWKDTLLNFGKVKEGDTVRLQFAFKNTGNKLLFINDVRPSCGCTIANYPEKPFSPGDSGFITVVFTTDWHPGMQQKSIMVKANTKGRVNHKLIFSGDVTPKKASKNE